MSNSGSVTYSVSVTDEQVAARFHSWDGWTIELTEVQVNLLLAQITDAGDGTDAYLVAPREGPK